MMYRVVDPDHSSFGHTLNVLNGGRRRIVSSLSSYLIDKYSELFRLRRVYRGYIFKVGRRSLS